MNAEHERALAVSELTGVPAEVPWRTFGVVAQVIFFLLTCGGMAAFYALFATNGIVTGIVSLAVAEYLIRARRWRRTGVESALWIGALFAFISEIPSSGKPEAFLLLAAAAAAAGARVRNPLFGALAAGLTMHYFEEKWDLGVLCALVLGVAAIALLCRTWRRPSTEWLFVAIVVILPLAGYAEADREWRSATIALYAAFGVIASIAAIIKRHHAFFLAAATGFTIASIELARDLPFALEAKLAIGGAFLLGSSLVVARMLRDRARGFVVTMESLTKADDLLEIAVTLSMTPPSAPEAPAGRESGGGDFGGAGASGSY
jgi:hypothetical protein